MAVETVRDDDAADQVHAPVREPVRNVIYLPADTTHIRFDEIAGLIACALHRDEDIDDAALERGRAIDQERLKNAGRKRVLGRPIRITDRELAEMQLIGELKRAVQERRLTPRNPLTLGVHTMPRGHALDSALVAVSDLRAFVSERGIEVVNEKPAPALRIAEDAATAGLGSGIDPEQRAPRAPWISKAQNRARAIIAEQISLDRYPPQGRIADQIAREFREAVPAVVGADGKPLTGATIKRHALRGISSAQGKARSTVGRRGK